MVSLLDRDMQRMRLTHYIVNYYIVMLLNVLYYGALHKVIR